ncbi:hypothetical protein LCGC14_2415010 [marine sediment metagenome]|uniref:Uncharacterized protein n=1 Tax=marine sediment metagenome TaxID=412755 RepID=A0A0F9BRD5_9ZZZZ
MLSRKERRVQKALGTEDGMPPTIRKRLQWWYWNRIKFGIMRHWTMDNFWQWLAFKLPKKLVYHSAIRTWAHATTCPSGLKECASTTTMSDTIKRWEKE